MSVRFGMCVAQINGLSTHNDPDHGEPHRLPRTESIAGPKGNDRAGEAAQVVYGDDNPQDACARMAHDIEKVIVAHDT